MLKTLKQILEEAIFLASLCEDDPLREPNAMSALAHVSEPSLAPHRAPAGTRGTSPVHLQRDITEHLSTRRVDGATSAVDLAF